MWILSWLSKLLFVVNAFPHVPQLSGLLEVVLLSSVIPDSLGSRCNALWFSIFSWAVVGSSANLQLTLVYSLLLFCFRKLTGCFENKISRSLATDKYYWPENYLPGIALVNSTISGISTIISIKLLTQSCIYCFLNACMPLTFATISRRGGHK